MNSYYKVFVHMSFSDRYATLENAKSLALSEDFEQALNLVELLLRNSPHDTEALCFKGNVLEMWFQFDRYHSSSDVAHTSDRRIYDAKYCYEMVLQEDPNSTRALRDLADNLKELGEKERALEYYNKLVSVLTEFLPDDSIQEDLEEAINERAELLNE